MHYAPVEAAGEQMYGFSMTAERERRPSPSCDGRMPAGPREVAGRTEDGGQARPCGGGDTIVLADPAADDGTREAVVVGEVLMPTFNENLFNEGLVLAPDALYGGAADQRTGEGTTSS